MTDFLIYFLVAVLCLTAGYFLGNYIQNLKTKSSQSALLERESILKQNITTLENKLLSLEDEKTLCVKTKSYLEIELQDTKQI